MPNHASTTPSKSPANVQAARADAAFRQRREEPARQLHHAGSQWMLETVDLDGNGAPIRHVFVNPDTDEIIPVRFSYEEPRRMSDQQLLETLVRALGRAYR